MKLRLKISRLISLTGDITIVNFVYIVRAELRKSALIELARHSRYFELYIPRSSQLRIKVRTYKQ